jgi:anthranilate phosphoribosyltransferase
MDAERGRVRFAVIFDKIARREMTAEDVRGAFSAILAGEWTSVQTGAFAAALRVVGETPEIIVAAAGAMRASMIAVEHDLPRVLDTCGTGGDGAHTINVSTAAAFVLAALGVPVAKHGNRSVSSQCGSADVIEALGGRLDVAPDAQAGVLREAGFAFLLAPAHHPALKHAGEARRELGVRTIFNALGPLANPARATHQLVGVYADELRPIVARALGDLGVVRAWVVRSTDGLDEVSPDATTRVSMLENGRVEEREVSPATFGVAPSPLARAAGKTARDNADAVTAILRGDAHPGADAVRINAAAALVVADGVAPEEAYRRAAASLAKGEPHRALESWKAAVARLAR